MCVSKKMSARPHFDEIHNYVDHGELKESRGHLHFYVIPEINGKLNGKQFSSKKRMIELNKKIDELARTKYHKKFLTHEKPRKRTVEELKAITNDETERLIKRNNVLEGIRQDLNKKCIEGQKASFSVKDQIDVYKGFIEYKGLEKEFDRFSLNVAKTMVKSKIKQVEQDYDLER